MEEGVFAPDGAKPQPSAFFVQVLHRRSGGEAIGGEVYRVTRRSLCRNAAATRRLVFLLQRFCHKLLLVRRLSPEQRQRLSHQQRKKSNGRFVTATAWTEPQESPFYSPLVQALAPRTVRGPKTSATLGKPLAREFLLHPYCQLLSKPLGSGLCVTREPRLPRIHATLAT